MNKRIRNRRIKRIRNVMFAITILSFLILFIIGVGSVIKTQNEIDTENKTGTQNQTVYKTETQNKSVLGITSELEEDTVVQKDMITQNLDEMNNANDTNVTNDTDETSMQSPALADTIDEQLRERIESMTMDEKILQMFMVTPEALTGENKVTKAGELTKEALKNKPVGGIIYFAHNFIDPDQTKEMLANTKQYAEEASGLPIFLGVDEEGGKVARIASNIKFGVTQFPDMAEIGESKDPQKAYEVGSVIGAYLSDLGLNVDFAPDVDVLTNPENTAIGTRSFGSDPKNVSIMGMEVAKGMGMEVAKGLQEHDVLSCAKHFPGHGATTGDTHNGYSFTEKTLNELMQAELIPFREAVKKDIPFIMISHISIPNVTGNDLPASMSEDAVGILREFGYNGIIITDALNMGAVSDQYESGEAAVLSIKAGVDMLLMPEDFQTAFDAVKAAVIANEINESRIDEAVYRILRVKLQKYGNTY